MTQLWKNRCDVSSGLWKISLKLSSNKVYIVVIELSWKLKAEWQVNSLRSTREKQCKYALVSSLTHNYTNSPNAYLVHFWETNSLESIRWNLVKRRLRRSQCSRVVSAYGDDVLQQRAIHLKRKRNTSYEKKKKKIKEEWTNKEKKRMLTQREILGHRHTSRIVSRPFIYP